jgi:hypothetical protein
MNSLFVLLSRPPAIGPMNTPQWKYGFLLLNLLLLGFQVWCFTGLSASYSGNRYFGLVVCTMLVLNYVSFNFWFGPRSAVILRVLSLFFSVGGLIFVILSI